jgi:predicted acyl esterase
VKISGQPVANLVASTSGTDSDWVVKLIDVYPDDYPDPDPNPAGVHMGGYQQLVRGDVMRGKFRTSYERPEPFTPGAPTPVRYALPDVSHTFRAGHRIMVQVQSTWFPLYDRNPQSFVPNIFEATASDYRAQTHRIYRTRANPSRVELQTF